MLRPRVDFVTASAGECRINKLCVDLACAGDFTASMRTLLSAISVGVLVLCGCSGHRGGSPTFSEVPITVKPSSSLARDKLIFTPDNLLVGKVVKANADGRYVVMNFPIGHLPSLDQRLSIFRRGLKIGEIRVTGPQLDDNVVGDIVAGDAQAGDDVRAQ